MHHHKLHFQMFRWDLCYVKVDQWNSKFKSIDFKSQIGEGTHFRSIRVTWFQVKCTSQLNGQRSANIEKNCIEINKMYLQRLK